MTESSNESTESLDVFVDKKCSKEFFELLMEGFSTFPAEFHRDWQPIEVEPTLWALFMGAYGCVGDEVTAEDVSDWLEELKGKLQLTKNANNGWTEKRKAARKEESQGPGMLVELLKHWHKEFYNGKLVPYYKAHSKKTLEGKIDLTDDFDWEAFSDKCWSDAYVIKSKGEGEPDTVDVEAMLKDLHRLLVFVGGPSGNCFVSKEYDVNVKKQVLKVSNYEQTRTYMNGINVMGKLKNPRTGKWEAQTVWKIYEMGGNKLSFKKKYMTFYSEDERVLSLWHGWKYSKVENVDWDIVEKWKAFVLEVICAGNEKLAEYTHKWIANPLQHPGARNNRAQFIYGKQGTGKTVFTKIIAELFMGYCLPNVTNTDHITGHFNGRREGVALVISNESQPADKKSVRNQIDYNGMKSPITDDTFECENKGLMPRTVENYNNFIFTTNHKNALYLAEDDRHFQIYKVSDKCLTDLSPVRPFFKQNWSESMFNSLMTYYLTLDLTDFDPTMEIETDGRKEVMEISKSPYRLFVEEHFDAFEKGWTCEDCYDSYSNWCRRFGFTAGNMKTFGSALKEEYCNHVHRGPRGQQVWKYIIKAEFAAKYKRELAQMENDYDEDEDLELSIPDDESDDEQ